ncbi:MAG: YdeI/OmpD-associated family protein [Pseudomonadota bacterium]
MAKPKLDDLERVEIKNAGDLRDWLQENCESDQSIWLVTYKKTVPERYVSYDEIVDVAICFGWIDSLPRKLDERRTMLLLSPRKPGSAWSAVNKKRVERMAAQGLIHPRGAAAIEAAKKDGSWDFLNDVDQLIEPDDLKAALDGTAEARTKFDGFSRSSRRGILEWIKQAKRPETRAKRVSETVRLAALGVKANH